MLPSIQLKISGHTTAGPSLGVRVLNAGSGGFGNQSAGPGTFGFTDADMNDYAGGPQNPAGMGKHSSAVFGNASWGTVMPGGYSYFSCDIPDDEIYNYPMTYVTNADMSLIIAQGEPDGGTVIWSGFMEPPTRSATGSVTIVGKGYFQQLEELEEGWFWQSGDGDDWASFDDDPFRPNQTEFRNSDDVEVHARKTTLKFSVPKSTVITSGPGARVDNGKNVSVGRAGIWADDEHVITRIQGKRLQNRDNSDFNMEVEAWKNPQIKVKSPNNVPFGNIPMGQETQDTGNDFKRRVPNADRGSVVAVVMYATQGAPAYNNAFKLTLKELFVNGDAYRVTSAADDDWRWTNYTGDQMMLDLAAKYVFKANYGDSTQTVEKYRRDNTNNRTIAGNATTFPSAANGRISKKLRDGTNTFDLLPIWWNTADGSVWELMTHLAHKYSFKLAMWDPQGEGLEFGPWRKLYAPWTKTWRVKAFGNDAWTSAELEGPEDQYSVVNVKYKLKHSKRTHHLVWPVEPDPYAGLPNAKMFGSSPRKRSFNFHMKERIGNLGTIAEHLASFNPEGTPPGFPVPTSVNGAKIVPKLAVRIAHNIADHLSGIRMNGTIGPLAYAIEEDVKGAVAFITGGYTVLAGTATVSALAHGLVAGDRVIITGAAPLPSPPVTHTGSNGKDGWVNEFAKNQVNATNVTFSVDDTNNNRKISYLDMNVLRVSNDPLLTGATVTAASLVLTLNANQAVNRNYTLNRVNNLHGASVENLSWNDERDQVPTNSVTVTDVIPSPAGSTVTFNITAMMQDVANGQPMDAIAVSTGATTELKFRSTENAIQPAVTASITFVPEGQAVNTLNGTYTVVSATANTFTIGGTGLINGSAGIGGTAQKVGDVYRSAFHIRAGDKLRIEDIPFAKAYAAVNRAGVINATQTVLYMDDVGGGGYAGPSFLAPAVQPVVKRNMNIRMQDASGNYEVMHITDVKPAAAAGGPTEWTVIRGYDEDTELGSGTGLSFPAGTVAYGWFTMRIMSTDATLTEGVTLDCHFRPIKMERYLWNLARKHKAENSHRG